VILSRLAVEQKKEDTPVFKAFVAGVACSEETFITARGNKISKGKNITVNLKN
jgi:hypothetical protein